MSEVPPRYRLSSYSYHLPQDLIAQFPIEQRSKSRLLVLDRRTGYRLHTTFENVVFFLRPGDRLVINDTRVIPARLFAVKETGGRVEVFFVEESAGIIVAMLRKAGRINPGSRLKVLDRNGKVTDVLLEVVSVGRGQATLRCASAQHIKPRELLERFGHVPLPPYIKRQDTPKDLERYQTVYARHEGAVAAPTAGLHFDEVLLKRIQGIGVIVLPVTLHVGPGTFKPVRSEDIRLHQVDPERYDVPQDTAREITEALRSGSRVIAVGTTVVRVLESAFFRGEIRPGPGVTSLTIIPGHRFKVVSGLITNFHLPCSSLLVLVSAFAGRERILRAYREAVRLGYRFYSYGDAMIII